uniref:Secreted protein n=1 Tax=Mesocestoides corti TaxID=53468 RepID=A0A5K3EJC6_MESCO
MRIRLCTFRGLLNLNVHIKATSPAIIGSSNFAQVTPPSTIFCLFLILTPRPASQSHLNLLALRHPWLIYTSCICSKSQLTVDVRYVFNFHAIPPNSMRRPMVSTGNRGLRLLYAKSTIRG